MIKMLIQAFLMVSQKVRKVRHFERQREVFPLNRLVLLGFLSMVEMATGQSGLFASLSIVIRFAG
jgi:hypothetical protein